jgi:hypothetical protein
MMITMAAPLIAMIPMACRRRKSALMLLQGKSRTCHHFIVMHSPWSQPLQPEDTNPFLDHRCLALALVLRDNFEQ